MGINATYEFWPNRVHADVYVEYSSGTDKPPRITVPPICLMRDDETWEITWEIKPGQGVATAEFHDSDGIAFGDSIPPRFQVIDSRIDTNDSTKWTVTCDSQVATANTASYEIHLIVNGQRFMHDPSIAVTTDPIPPTSTPWPHGG